jgi:hypothetical protein
VPRAGLAVAVVPLALVPALGAVEGGFSPGAWVWSGALAAWAVALALVLGAEIAAPAAAWVWLAAVFALLGWTILSAVWSANEAQSVLEARRTLVYATVTLALVVLARRGATRVLVLATQLAISGLIVYALARYLFGERQTDALQGDYLNRPLGYANAVGILAVVGLLLALGLVAHDRPRAVRAWAAGTVPLLSLALVLTGSDASWLALGVGLAALALLDPSASAVLRALAVTGPGAVVLAWLGHWSGLTATTGTPHLGGRELGIVAAIVAIATGVAGGYVRLREGTTGPRIVVAAVICAAVAGALVAVDVGATQPRSTYWHVAWREYADHPILGSGAGTFAHYWVQSGEVPAYGGALDAHSLYLEMLAELGPIGLVLVATMLLVPLYSGVRNRRAPYVPCAAGAYLAFLVHAGLDWDWEMPAVVVAALACAAALVGSEAGHTRPFRSRVPLLVGALVLGLLAIVGARSNAVPGAVPGTEKTPPSGVFVSVVVPAGPSPLEEDTASSS